jgi:hypothetical protein
MSSIRQDKAKVNEYALSLGKTVSVAEMPHFTAILVYPESDTSHMRPRTPVRSRIFLGGVHREDVAVSLRGDPVKDAPDVLEIRPVGRTNRDHRLPTSTLTSTLTLALAWTSAYSPPIPNIQLSLPTVKRLR